MGAWIIRAFVALGILGFIIGTYRAYSASAPMIAKGDFWEARDDEGRHLEADPLGSLLLKAGQRIEWLDDESEDREYHAFYFSGQRENQPSYFEAALRDDQGRELILRAAPESSHGVVLAFKDREGKVIPLAQRKDKNILGPISQRLTVRFVLDKDCLTAEINGRKVLQKKANPWRKGTLVLKASQGACRIFGMGAAGIVRDASGAEKPFTLQENFSSLPSASPWPATLGMLLKAGLLVLAALWYLRSLCLGRPPLGLLGRALVLLLLPPSLYLITGWFREVDAASGILWTLFVPGAVMALFAFRNHFRTAEPQSRVEKAASLLAMLAALSAAAWAAGEYCVRFHEPSSKAEEIAQTHTPSPSYKAAEIVELGPANALSVEGTFRNVALTAKVTLEQDSILQVRLRALNPDWTQGIVLWLSANRRCANRFFLETLEDLKPLGGGSAAVPHGKSLNLVVKAEGRSFEARVGGVRVAHAHTRIFPEGNIVLLTGKGSAKLEDLKILSMNTKESGSAWFLDFLSGAAWPLGFILLYAFLTCRLLRIPFFRVLGAESLCLLPLVPAWLGLSPRGPADTKMTVISILAALLTLLLFPMIHGRSAARWKFILLTILLLPAALAAFFDLRERGWPASSDAVGELSMADWHGKNLQSDLVHIQHPMLRRWNHYLARHEFRGRSHALEKKPGTKRILALGTSSTYGYWVEAPYAVRLEGLLKEEGFDVEVMVGAVRGGSGNRILPFLENVLLEFSPDIITLSLFYNDSYALTQWDEGAYLKRITAPDYSHTLFDEVRDRVKVREGAARINGLTQAFKQSKGDLELEEGPGSPPARFETMLRAYAELARDRGIELVLMKEPVAGGMDRLWKEEFYAAMDRVAEAFGLPVVDPTPRLNAMGGAKLFRDDVHPFDDGDAVIAKVLLPVIRELLTR